MFHKEKLDSKTKSHSMHPKKCFYKHRTPINPFQKTMELPKNPKNIS